MKAWIKHAGGLTLDDVPTPTPASDELLLKVEAISLNRGELRGVARAPEGTVPGWDVAGTVVAGAANGKGPTAGARVAALLTSGGWAEVARVPAAHAAVIPDNVAIDIAATLPVATLTIIRALDVAGSMLGRTMLVTGGTGGVGQLAIQLGRLAGATVTAVSSRRPQWDLLRALGAREIVAAIEEVKGTFDLILESVGGRSLAVAVDHVARGGIVVTIGNSSEEETSFNARALYAKGGARLYGLLVFEEVESRRVGASDLERVLSFVQSGELQAPLEVRRGWTELPVVLDELERRVYSGKAVLTVP
jgi:NADPH:quinone reductase-like Zn-dependent oxidoreductase